jgi:hypothetical protein
MFKPPALTVKLQWFKFYYYSLSSVRTPGGPPLAPAYTK